MSIVFVPLYAILSDLWASYTELNFAILEKGGVAARFINDIKKEYNKSSEECVPVTVTLVDKTVSLTQVKCSDENELVKNSSSFSKLSNIQFRKKLHQTWMKNKMQKNLTIVAFNEYDKSRIEKDMLIKPLLDLIYPGLFDMVYFTTVDGQPKNTLQSFWQLYRKSSFYVFFAGEKDINWLIDAKNNFVSDERFEISLLDIENQQISIDGLDDGKIPPQKDLNFLSQYLAPVGQEFDYVPVTKPINPPKTPPKTQSRSVSGPSKLLKP